MKPKVKHIVLSALALALCSCGHKSTKKVAPTETDTTYVAVEEEEAPGLSHFSDTLSDGKYHQIILEAIANGDKQTFAKIVSYPLNRPYPLPDIETEGQMVRYFDTLFDKQFRQQVAKLDSNSWDNVGWRGSMILDGEIWDTDPVICINYSSPLEQRYAEYLRKKDMSRLHPSLRGNWEPYYGCQLDGSACPGFEYSFARVDVSTDQETDKEPSFRVAVFKKGTMASDVPDVVLLGKRVIEGSMQLETLYFESDKQAVIIVMEDVEDGKTYFTIYNDKKKDETRKHVPFKKCLQPFQ